VRSSCIAILPPGPSYRAVGQAYRYREGASAAARHADRHQLLGHWTVGSTMRYVRPSATFIEDAYRRAVTTTINELSAEEAPV